MRKSLVVLGLLLVASLPLHAKTSFSGTYAVSGINPGVGPYSGTLTVVARGEVYDVMWVIGNVQYSGIGVVVNDVLSVAYIAADRSWMGVIVYRQRLDGSLEGKWAVQGCPGRPGTEAAVRK